MEHRAPWQCTFAKEEKSKCKAGIPPKSDQEYFEILSLCILQTGLNWRMVRKNWLKFKQGFYNFDIDSLAKTTTNELLKKPNIIRNMRKVEALRNNAKEFQRIIQEYGSFSNFLQSLKKTKDEEVIRMITIKFKYVGEYNAEYYLHSVGYWKA